MKTRQYTPYYQTPTDIVSRNKQKGLYENNKNLPYQSSNIQNIEGTVKSIYRFWYIRGRKEKLSDEIEGQSTTSKGQSIQTEYRGLIRNAYADALIKFKEVYGVSYEAVVRPVHIKTYIQYYGDKGKSFGKITPSKVKEQITENADFDYKNKENIIQSYEQKSRKEQSHTPISRKESKRKVYENVYNTKSKYR